MFECADCDRVFRSDRAIDDHCYSTYHTRYQPESWYCDLCDRTFWSEQGYDQHCANSAAHRESWYCEPCDRDFSSENAYEMHLSNSSAHRRSWYCELCDKSFSSETGYDQHCTYSLAHQDLWECEQCDRTFYSEQSYEQHCAASAAHRTCWTCNTTFHSVYDYDEHNARRHAPAKKVGCNFCSKMFKTPSAFAQHLESGVHGVTRQQVTRAVEYLRVVPQITIAPSIQHNSTSRIEAFEEEVSTPPDTLDVDNSVPLPSQETSSAASQSPTPVEPGPPLGPREAEAAAAVTSDPPPAAAAVASTDTTILRRTQPTGLRPFANFLNDGPMPTYVPNDFINQGIPYACVLCFKTFRNVFALTAHMNSPVHDPDMFKCPKCERRFGYVSALIQHLESGSCRLASPAEIFDRFHKLTARFSRLLTA